VALCGTLLRVDRLERLVVHVEEALRLAREPREAHQRLALMLLDSAAELILHRTCQGERTYEHMQRQVLEMYQAAEAEGRPLDAEGKPESATSKGACQPPRSRSKSSGCSTPKPSS
jgi:hypothetical protein